MRRSAVSAMGRAGELVQRRWRSLRRSLRAHAPSSDANLLGSLRYRCWRNCRPRRAASAPAAAGDLPPLPLKALACSLPPLVCRHPREPEAAPGVSAVQGVIAGCPARALLQLLPTQCTCQLPTAPFARLTECRWCCAGVIGCLVAYGVLQASMPRTSCSCCSAAALRRTAAVCRATAKPNLPPLLRPAPPIIPTTPSLHQRTISCRRRSCRAALTASGSPSRSSWCCATG